MSEDHVMSWKMLIILVSGGAGALAGFALSRPGFECKAAAGGAAFGFVVAMWFMLWAD